MADAPPDNPSRVPPGVVLLAASAMGTRFELVLPDDGSPESERRSAGEAALAEIVELDGRLSLFRKDSLLSHINRVAPREWVRVDDDTFALLALCNDVWRDSIGLFDVTVAPIMREWGLHADSVLSDDVAARADGGAIELDGSARLVRFRVPVALDLGGVAKGFAIDVGIRALREAGIAHAILHGGTSAIAAIGHPRPTAIDAGQWRVGITLPDGAVVVNMAEQAMCVSADAGRIVDDRGHIVDPRTEEPVPLSATPTVAAVQTPLAALPHACATCDAWTKPVLLHNGERPDRMPPWLRIVELAEEDG